MNAKQKFKKPNLLVAYDKIRKCIESCVTEDQLVACRRMYYSFRDGYLLSEIKEYETDLFNRLLDKENDLENEINYDTKDSNV